MCAHNTNSPLMWFICKSSCTWAELHQHYKAFLSSCSFSVHPRQIRPLNGFYEASRQKATRGHILSAFSSSLKTHIRVCLYLWRKGRVLYVCGFCDTEVSILFGCVGHDGAWNQDSERGTQTMTFYLMYVFPCSRHNGYSFHTTPCEAKNELCT